MNSVFDERMKIKRVAGNEEMESLSDERQSHGARRKNSVAFWIPPLDNPVCYQNYQNCYCVQTNLCPHFLTSFVSSSCLKERKRNGYSMCSNGSVSDRLMGINSPSITLIDMVTTYLYCFFIIFKIIKIYVHNDPAEQVRYY